MKMPCHVVEDLLPLYHDGVCSQESNALVEEHLKQCGNCNSLLSRMQSETASIVLHVDDSAPIKSIHDQWTKSKKKAFFKGGIIAVFMCLFLFGAYCGLTKWKCIPVPSDLLEVTEVSLLADGRIIYHLNVKDDKQLYFIKITTNEDGSYYMTPMRSIIESKRTIDKGFFNEYFTVDIAETNAYQQTNGKRTTITSCYVGSQDNAILVWEDGMELPKASEALEEIVK